MSRRGAAAQRLSLALRAKQPALYLALVETIGNVAAVFEMLTALGEAIRALPDRTAKSLMLRRGHAFSHEREFVDTAASHF